MQKTQKSLPSIRIIKEVTHFDVNAHTAYWKTASLACLTAKAQKLGKPVNPRDVISDADARSIGTGTIEEYFQGSNYARYETTVPIPDFTNFDSSTCRLDSAAPKIMDAKIIKGCTTTLIESSTQRIEESTLPKHACEQDRKLSNRYDLSTRKAKIAGHECTYQDLSLVPGTPAPCFLSAYPFYTPVGIEVHLMDDLEVGKAGQYKTNQTAVAKEIEIGVTIPPSKFEMPGYAASYSKEKL
jgi:hypothetical protein